MTRNARTDVLYIDDDILMETVLRLRLEYLEGFSMTYAATGQAGLDRAREDPPKAILLDWHMPGMDGWDTLRALKADPRTQGIPVYMLTGCATMEYAECALSHGASGYFTKPLNLALISARIRQTVEETA